MVSEEHTLELTTGLHVHAQTCMHTCKHAYTNLHTREHTHTHKAQTSSY